MIVTAIVAEKELRLRAMMVQMGLRNSAYWVTTFLAHAMVTVPLLTAFVGLGYAMQLKWFVRSSALLVIPLFALWGLCQVAFAFFLSTLFFRTRVATIVSYMLMLAGIAASNVLNLVVFVSTIPPWYYYLYVSGWSAVAWWRQ